MIIIFFKTNVECVINLIKADNHCAFWYSKGLSSYRYLDTSLTIDSIKIEQGIYEDFKKDYPEFLQKYKCEVLEETSYTTPNVVEQKKMCFFASNDTIMRSFKDVLVHFKATEYEVFCRPNENAASVANKFNIKITEITSPILNPEKYSLLVLGNDWGAFERKLNLNFYAKKINTVCIQESSIDFNPVDDRMRNCTFPLFQGVATLENLDIRNKISAVIGNSRFEQLKPSPLPLHQTAVINVNFTYGVFEESRDMWVKGAVDACKEVGIDYFISQHPRDKGDLSAYIVRPSNPLVVHDSLIESSVLISRFSALLTEAICLGRPAIYYNPHGEDMHYKFSPDNKMFFYATNEGELKKALLNIFAASKEHIAIESNFLARHIGNSVEGKASEYTALLLKDLIKYPLVKRLSFKTKLKSTGKYLKFLLLQKIRG
jgi:hypothetical protein